MFYILNETKVFQSVDFILTPVTHNLPQPLDEFMKFDNRTRTTLNDVCTVAVNLAGLPAVSIPMGISSKFGLPIGLQLIGPYFSELKLLNLAKRLEQRAQFDPLINMDKLLDSI